MSVALSQSGALDGDPAAVVASVPLGGLSRIDCLAYNHDAGWLYALSNTDGLLVAFEPDPDARTSAHRVVFSVPLPDTAQTAGGAPLPAVLGMTIYQCAVLFTFASPLTGGAHADSYTRR